MSSNSWELLEELYGRARTEAVGAWEELREKAVSMLTRWVLRHLDVGKLSPWELEDAVLEGFEEATRRMEAISTWHEAWKYSRQSVLRKVLRKLNRVKIIFVRFEEGIHSLDSIDPFSLRPFELVDFVDSLDGFLKRIDRSTAEFISQLLEAVLSSPASTLGDIAGRISMSESSLDRKIRELKRIVSNRLKS